MIIPVPKVAVLGCPLRPGAQPLGDPLVQVQRPAVEATPIPAHPKSLRSDSGLLLCGLIFLLWLVVKQPL